VPGTIRRLLSRMRYRLPLYRELLQTRDAVSALAQDMAEIKSMLAMCICDVDVRRIALTAYQPAEVDDLVRLGCDSDGGYVVSRRCVDRTKALLTFGIGENWSFERQFVAYRPQASVLSLDPSVDYAEFDTTTLALLRRTIWETLRGRPGRIEEVRRQFRMARDFQSFYGAPDRRFLRFRLSDRDDDTHLTLERLIAQHLNGFGIDEMDLFIKMDIEGDEYRCLPLVLRYATHVNGLVVEFHDLDLRWREFVEVMESLLSALAVCHIHGNNYRGLIPGTRVPRMLEVTMINKRLLPVNYPLSDRNYPISGLDQPNDPSKPDIELSWNLGG
jgi:hypothetical protein